MPITTPSRKPVSIILAIDNKWGIGKWGKLPWKLSQDMQYFKEMTSITLSSKKKNVVLMGRKTWESIPEKYRPLPWRENVILTRDPNFTAPVPIYHSLKEAIETLSLREDIETIFIIWGATIYNEAVSWDIGDKIYLTKVLWDFDCDAFFTGVPGNYRLDGISEKIEEHGLIYQWLTYERMDLKTTSKLNIINHETDTPITPPKLEE